ncbi:MAG: hydroxyacid dehydrogenase [Chloroflexi bacterium]|nr:hydroxyacid dehydrogenase [Chloroflexota bacterium]
MFRVWFERAVPPAYTAMLEGVALAIGPASATPASPLMALPEAQAIIAASRIRYDGALMDQAPLLRVISRTGIGFDNIAIADATARGIAVCNAPDGPTISTAEHTITLMLAVAKELKQVEGAMQRREKKDFFNDHNGLELYGLRLGVVGLGRIGSHVAKVALALGMEVVAFDPYISSERALGMGVEMLPTVEELLRTADIVSLHMPLTPATRHLINGARLAQMKTGAILINAARGGLVDETALIEALESGHIRGAGLDVFDPEPPHPDNPLLHRENVVATPHIAGVTTASKDRLWRTAITQALQVLRGARPAHLVNPEVWSRIV